MVIPLLANQDLTPMLFQVGCLCMFIDYNQVCEEVGLGERHTLYITEPLVVPYFVDKASIMIMPCRWFCKI